MTMAPPVRPEAVALPAAGTGERRRRRLQRRRLGRQQLLVVVLMVLALVVTVAVLAQQWLATGAAPGNQGLHGPVTGILSVLN
jgi:cell division septal protein FtsQ